MSGFKNSVFWFIVFSSSLLLQGILGANNIDYKGALRKSLLFYEAQRSGKLPLNQRVQWRGDSGLQDGKDSGVDLSGGYYDAGDNLKLGFPLAFTITMLSWSTIEFVDKLKVNNELVNALEAIRWGTEYLIKAHPRHDVLYGEIGDPDSDHECWQRPEDMTTPRTAFAIDAQHPGSDLAAETSAAFAAASVAFKPTDPTYASTLLTHAKQLYDFAKSNLGIYSESIPAAAKLYSSSGFDDELMWAAAWLHRATEEQLYLDDLKNAQGPTADVTAFSWDNKFLGAQVLGAKLAMEAEEEDEDLESMRMGAEDFICNFIQKGDENFKKTGGGLVWFMEWNNVQYVTTATFATAVYSNYLTANKNTLECSGEQVSPADLLAAGKSQVDYILGANPRNMSYMVGFGTSFPQQIHHRAASIVSIKKDPSPVSCKGGFDAWFNKNGPNPNVLDGAIVSPDENDGYSDSRGNFKTAEPTIVTNAPFVGVLAQFA